jgi:hypothetical protein
VIILNGESFPFIYMMDLLGTGAGNRYTIFRRGCQEHIRKTREMDR